MYEVIVELKEWEQAAFVENRDRDIHLDLEQFRDQLNYWLANWHVHHTKGIAQLIWRLRRKWHI